MLLILTNSNDVTADYLQPVLRTAGITFERLDTDTLLSHTKLSLRDERCTLTTSHRGFTPSDIDNLWYRRPEALKPLTSKVSPEEKYTVDEWSDAFEGFLSLIPSERWVNHPSANANASHKIEQFFSARRVGLSVPESIVTQSPEEAQEFFVRHTGRVVVKPLSSGYIHREDGPDSLIYTNQLTASHLENCDSLRSCPTLFQQYIQKSADIRITIVGSDLHAVALEAKDADGYQRCDIRRNNMADVVYKSIQLPYEIRQQLFLLINHYQLRFAAIDMVVNTNGEWFFLEINPNGQWAWLDLEAGTRIADSFAELFSV